VLENLRYAVRQLFRAPTFTIVTILTLALGVGANTAIFSVIQAVLLHPSGVQDPERVASFHAKYMQLNLPSIGVSAPDFQDAQSMHGMVDAAAMVQAASFNATFDGRTQHLRAARASQQWFQVFGAEPILGRTFLPEEDQKGAERVIVLSYAAWQRMFGGQHEGCGAVDSAGTGADGFCCEQPLQRVVWQRGEAEAGCFGGAVQCGDGAEEA
jgi:hypothetical protein